MKTYGIIAAIAAVCAQPAFAEDMQDTAFGGPYIGVQAGYSFFDTSLSFTPGVGTVDMDPDGFEGGLYAGYGITRGMFYGAVEVEGNLSSADGNYVPRPSNPSNRLNVEYNYSLGASAIGGVVVKDKVLLYGRVGYEYLDGDVSGLNIAEDMNFSGVRVGAGIDYGVTMNIHVRAEYTHTFYQTEDYAAGGTNRLEVDPSQGLARIGVHWTF